MATPDITVHGAGIFGLSIAWTAAKRGATVRVIEVAHPGAGASGGIVGALAPHVPENWNAKKAFQLQSLLMAERWWATVQAAGGLDPLYARTGRLQPVADDASLRQAQARAATAKTLWQGRATWQVVRATGADWEPSSHTGWLIHDTLTARLHPRAGLAALIAALRAKGVDITTCAADARGPQVWATGYAGLLALSQDRPRQVGGGVKGQAISLRHDAGDLPQIFTDGLHIIGHGDGTVAIGSTSEREWADPATTDTRLDLLLEQARAALPCLAHAPVVERWAGIRPRARSRAPMLGPWPDRPGHFIANGGFKIGFGMAPLVAEAMTDLLLEGRDTIPEGFRVSASL
ncbi:FAD-binding oxidoreductase [Pseudorhodobacter sp.]|uniref:NAD(P)/FAD-dependent oxidoreductase n=1 Tax=Pseudorhodobacter sp. TaxID=1934400 RepID=UPI002648BF1A|nr:FAD-binding oxidoreductase [Pseudorhodobacter sp.]MDN5786619.1 FAD-binding oxidoreductase [Pseudorhodobacter sp.]